VIHHISQRREPAVVIEPSLLVREQTSERGSAVSLGRGTVSLKVVDTYISGRVRVPAGFRVQGRHLAAGALRLPAEEGSALDDGGVERSDRRLRCWDRELIDVQRRELRCNAIISRVSDGDVAEAIRGGNRE
jgi:hypothetical protein